MSANHSMQNKWDVSWHSEVASTNHPLRYTPSWHVGSPPHGAAEWARGGAGKRHSERERERDRSESMHQRWRCRWLRWGWGHKLCIHTCCFGLLYLWDSVHSKSQGSKDRIKNLQWMRGRVPRRCRTLVRLALSQVTSPSIQSHFPQSQQKLQDWTECEKTFISTTQVLAHVGISFK